MDSAVGNIALKRIGLLRSNVSKTVTDFPDGTKLFHMNDSAVAVCDVDLPVTSMHADSQSISSPILNVDEAIKAIRFLGASAKLHQATIGSEHDSKIGPAGRTFVVLGNRWQVESQNDGVEDVPELQANLAFAEAYTADSLGSKCGFTGRCWDSLYVNDLMWHVMNIGLHHNQDVERQICDRISANKNEERWSNKLRVNGKSPIEINVFHRKRLYYALMSHHTIDLLNEL